MKTLNVDCPKCGADPGKPCKLSHTRRSARHYHAERVKKAKILTSRHGEDFSQAAARIVKEATRD